MSAPGTLDTAGIRARAEAASPGPYRAKAYVGPEGYIDSWEILAPFPIEGHPNAVRTIAQEMDEADAAHAADMDPPTTLALVDEVERLRRELSDVSRNRDAMARCEATALEMMAGEHARADEADRCHEASGRRLGDTIDKMLTRAEAAEAEAAKLRARVAELEGALGLFLFGDPALEEVLWGSLPDDATGTMTFSLKSLRNARRVSRVSRVGDAP